MFKAKVGGGGVIILHGPLSRQCRDVGKPSGDVQSIETWHMDLGMILSSPGAVFTCRDDKIGRLPRQPNLPRQFTVNTFEIPRRYLTPT